LLTNVLVSHQLLAFLAMKQGTQNVTAPDRLTD
jgi:hypothetical protein